MIDRDFMVEELNSWLAKEEREAPIEHRCPECKIWTYYEYLLFFEENGSNQYADEAIGCESCIGLSNYEPDEDVEYTPCCNTNLEKECIDTFYAYKTKKNDIIGCEHCITQFEDDPEKDW